MKARSVIAIMLSGIALFILGGFVVYQVVTAKENKEEEKIPVNGEEDSVANKAKERLEQFFEDASGTLGWTMKEELWDAGYWVDKDMLTDSFKSVYTANYIKNYKKDSYVICDVEGHYDGAIDIFDKTVYSKIYKELWGKNYNDFSSKNEIENNLSIYDVSQDFLNEIKNNNFICGDKKYSINNYDTFSTTLSRGDMSAELDNYIIESVTNDGENKYNSKFYALVYIGEGELFVFEGKIEFTYHGEIFTVNNLTAHRRFKVEGEL